MDLNSFIFPGLVYLGGEKGGVFYPWFLNFGWGKRNFLGFKKEEVGKQKRAFGFFFKGLGHFNNLLFLMGVFPLFFLAGVEFSTIFGGGISLFLN